MKRGLKGFLTICSLISSWGIISMKRGLKAKLLYFHIFDIQLSNSMKRGLKVRLIHALIIYNYDISRWKEDWKYKILYNLFHPFPLQLDEKRIESSDYSLEDWEKSKHSSMKRGLKGLY